MVKMFRLGIELERRMLGDRATPQHRGHLVVMDVTDQDRHRPVKVARLLSARGITSELFDVQLVWANENRITFTGDERVMNTEGRLVCYKQSWLCTFDTDADADGISGTQGKGKLPSR